MKSLKIFKRIFYAGVFVAALAACQNSVIPLPKPTSSKNELSDSTHVLTSDKIAEISSISDNTITFSEHPSYSVGDIIVSDISNKTPDGL